MAKSIIEQIADDLEDDVVAVGAVEDTAAPATDPAPVGAAATPAPPVDATPVPAPIPAAPAPVTPAAGETVMPSGVITVDLPLFMKLLSMGGCGGDPHRVASDAAQMVASGSKPCLTVADFEQMCAASAPAPAAPVDPMGVDAIASSMGDEMPGGDGMGDMGEIGSGDLPPFAGGDDAGDEGGDAGGESGSPPPPPAADKEEKKDGPPKEDKKDGPPEKKEEKKDDDKEKKDKPVDESAQPTMKPIVDPATPTAPVTEAAKKDDEAGEKKEKKKPWEKDDEEDKEDPSLAEEVSRLTRLMSPKSQLVFKETKNPNVIEFNAKPSSQFNQVFSEGLTKTVRNKQWLTENGFKTLAKFDGAAIAKASGPETRQFLVFSGK